MTSHSDPQSFDPTGSPDGEPVFLAVGQLGKPHGIRGEVNLTIHTDFPERLREGTLLFVGQEHQPMKIRHARPSGAKILLTFDGIQSREQAEELRNLMVYVYKAEIPTLPEGEYYYHQLLGLRVESEDGQDLGHLEEILPTGANDVYLIRLPNGRELLLPVIEGILLNVDFQVKLMRVRVLPGSMPE
jgi:16S rRNA processing protein RimM